MSQKRSLTAQLMSVIVSLLALCICAMAQDPTGRPKESKNKGKTPVKKPTKAEPQPITVTLTVLTNPPQSTVLVNGEERGVTDAEGKLQFEKLALGHYTIEVRKDGYGPVLRGFEAGTESPTLVFKLEPKLDDAVKEFNSLVAAGKLAGPETPNAFEFVEKLATQYGERTEIAQLRSALSARLIETATPAIAQSAMSWKTVTREQMVRALDAATNSLALKKDDARIQAETAYLRGVVALRDWQVAGASAEPPKPEGSGDASGNVRGPAAARAEFENALKLDETLAAARYQLGVVLLGTGEAAGAEAAFARVTVAEPRWASAHIGLGSAFYGQGKFAEAIAAYRKALEIEANNATAIAGIGLSRVMKGEKDGAKDIDRAMKVDPASAVPHLNQAIVLSQSKSKKDWTRAEEEFKKAISMNPQNLEFQNSAVEKMLADVQKRKK
ncbi:MAG TPA: tetratricopeptide repeat protein [Blastocatellia bacterium]|nr:tetratricopeptide repeat protein [Blastocatellia bacterium]